MKGRLRAVARLLVPPALAGGLIWFTLRGQDLGQLGAAILEVSPAVLLAGILFEALSIVLRAVRYRAMAAAAGCPAPYAPVLSATVISYFVTNLFPFRLGEFVRPLLIGRDTGHPFPRLLAAVGLERVIDILALAGQFVLFLILAPALLAGRAGAFGEGPIGRLFDRLAGWSQQGLMVGVLLAVALSALIAIPWLLLKGRSRLAALESRGGPFGRAAHWLIHLLESAAILGRPRVAAEVAVWTVLINACIVAGAILIAAASGTPVGLALGLLLTIATSIGYGIPVPGGMGGVQTAALLCLWKVAGHPELASRAAGWVFWGAFVLPMILWGGVEVWRRGLRIGSVVAEAKAEKAHVAE